MKILKTTYHNAPFDDWFKEEIIEIDEVEWERIKKNCILNEEGELEESRSQDEWVYTYQEVE